MTAKYKQAPALNEVTAPFMGVCPRKICITGPLSPVCNLSKLAPFLKSNSPPNCGGSAQYVLPWENLDMKD